MPATTPEAAHHLFVDAFNAGDVEALVALYEPNSSGRPLEPTQHSSVEVVRRQADGTWRYVIDHPFGAD